MINSSNIYDSKDKKIVTQAYQVVTSKSPNEVTCTNLTDVTMSPYSTESKKDKLDITSVDHLSTPSSSSSSFTTTIDTSHIDNTNNIHRSSILSPRDSENIERLKYETVKNELLDKLNLHILLSFKKRDTLKRELDRIHAQAVLLKKLHEDKQLLRKIEKVKEIEVKNRKDLIKSSITFLDTSKSNRSHSYSCTLLQSTPEHYYHTRSKSQRDLLNDSFWKDCIDNPILTSKSTRRGQQNSNKNDQHHNNKNNTSSKNNNHDIFDSIRTSGEKNQINKTYLKEYNNNPVFRRHDGILVLLTCSICGRQGFIAPQGIAIHVRTKHHKTYTNQKMAVLMNQWLLPDDLQDKRTLSKFKGLNIDPNVTYLPTESNSIDKNGYNKNKPKQKSLTHLSKIVSISSSKDNISRNSQNATSTVERQEYKINYLEKFCDKDELKNLVEIMETSKQDLEVILQNQTDNEIDEVIEYNRDEEDEDYDIAEDVLIDDKKLDSIDDTDYEVQESPLSNISSSPIKGAITDNLSIELDSSSSMITLASRRNLRKRRHNSRGSSEEDKDSIVLSWKERLRPAEKKPRPDMIALTELPEHERRSRHYNLRARSKLKSSSIDDDF